MPSKWVLASNNAGKLREFARLLAPLDTQIHAQSEFAVPECDEPFHTFVENALHKARHAARHTGLPALADDSGVCVPALNGAPGVFSARYAQLFAASDAPIETDMPRDEQNNRQLIHQLQSITADADAWPAYYYCVLVWVRHADDPQPVIADGVWWGEVIAQAAGAHGFGYDPHFWLPEWQQTAAQLLPEQKNAISHRGLAVQSLIRQIEQIRAHERG